MLKNFTYNSIPCLKFQSASELAMLFVALTVTIKMVLDLNCLDSSWSAGLCASERI